jgi:hypothetical protein
MSGTFIYIPPAGSGGQSPFFGDPVANIASLPVSGELGEVVYVIAENAFYAWDGAAWGPVLIKGPLPVSRGGTGIDDIPTNSVLYGQDTSAAAFTFPASQYQVLVGGPGGVPTFGQVNLDQSAATTGTLPINRGGTNSASALANGRMMVSTGGAVVEGTPTVSGGAIGAVTSLTLTGTSSFLKLAGLTTAQRDALTPQEGMMIFNSDVSRFQGYFGGAWGSLHGWGN